MKHYAIFILLLIISNSAATMKTTFFGPAASLEKPRYARYNLTSFEASFGYNQTTKSYNRYENKTDLLAYRGVEPLLPQFVNNTINIKTSKPDGYALFDAAYTSMNGTISWIQNIHESLFFELSTKVAYDTLNNITITPATASGKIITTPTNQLKEYLILLDHKIGTKQKRNYIGPSYCLVGYTKSNTDCHFFDFIDISVQTGCIIPIINLNKTPETFSIFPRQDIINIGIPLQVTIALGLYDWLNIGASGSLISYIKNDQIVSLNTALQPNKLIIPESGMCSVQHEPCIALSAYIEGEYFLPNWTWFVGVSYTKQHATRYQAADAQKFPTTIINKYPANYGWEVASFTVASEFDLHKEATMAMPRFKFMYTRPFYGKTCFASSLLAGQFGIELVYDF